MKVLLIGNYPNLQQESMQRWALLMRDMLVDAGHEVRLLQPEPIFGRLKSGATGVAKWIGYIDRFLLFPFYLRNCVRWADVAHICDHANAMYKVWLGKIPYVITCHDLLAIQIALGELRESHTGWSGRIYQRWILNHLKTANLVVCVSNHTARELIRIAGMPPDRVLTVFNALNYPYSPMPRDESAKTLAGLALDSSSSPYFLHVGGNQWYKNRLGVLYIFRALLQLPEYRAHRFIMAGKPPTDLLLAYVEREGLQERVLWLSAVSNEQLRALYSSAEALLFPSLYEGFGWPLIEAQSCGCLVITSERLPMTEVGGDAAIYINPNNVEEAVKKIQAGLSWRDEFIKAGLQNAVRFSRQTMLQGYLDSYKTVLGIVNQE